MKIFYLTPGCFDKGGISRYSRYQIDAFGELIGRENVFVFSVLGPSQEDFEEPFDVTYFAGGTSFLHRLAYILRVCYAALVSRPDLIIAAHVNLSGLASLLSKFVGGRSTVNIYGAEAWSAMRRDAEWGLRSADHVISDCHFTAKYVEENGFRPAGSVTVIWDCVDLNRFYPGSAKQDVLAKYGIPDPEAGFNILTLGRMSHDTAYKGYLRLLEVFARMADRVPQAKLIYAGRGQMIETLKARSKEFGLDRRVYFTGMVHEDDLVDIYRSAHVFSLVSNRGEGNGEGIPLTPLEASACGVPLIVGNHDGSQEAVIDGVNGYVLDPYELDAHAQILVTIAEDSELRAKLGCGARARAEQEFAFPLFVAKHKALLETWFSDGFSTLSQPTRQAVINV